MKIRKIDCAALGIMSLKRVLRSLRLRLAEWFYFEKVRIQYEFRIGCMSVMVRRYKRGVEKTAHHYLM